MTLATELPVDTVVDLSEAPSRRRLDSTILVSGLTIAAIILLWSVASRLALVSPVFLPSPLTVFESLGTVATAGFVDSTLAQHMLASLGRIFGALSVAIIAACTA